MLPVAVLAGGLGTRISSVVGNRPKILLPVAGRAFLEWKLESLARSGVERVLLLLGKGAPDVIDYLKRLDTLNLEVDVLVEEQELLGTGGALLRAIGMLGHSFWVTYGDNYIEVPMAEVERFFDERDCDAVMTVFRNRDRWDRSNIRIDGDLIVEYEKSAEEGRFEYIDYGMSIFTKAAFEGSTRGEVFDLTEVIRSLILRGRVRAFEVTSRFYDIGTPASLRETERYLKSRNSN